MIITVDGPAAVGKSVIAKALARNYDLVFLDTGALYRAVTLIVLRNGIDTHDQIACARVAKEAPLSFDRAGRIMIDGVPADSAVRTELVTRDVSAVSAISGVRAALVPTMRSEAHRLGGVVAEGRDMGTIVFPDADYKVFLGASAEVRAERRARALGHPERYPHLVEDIRRRDHIDRTRADSPLVQPSDAITVDTDHLDAQQVVSFIMRAIRDRALLTRWTNVTHDDSMEEPTRLEVSRRDDIINLAESSLPGIQAVVSEFASLDVEIRDRNAEFADRIQTKLDSLRGMSFGSLEANQRFAKTVRALLAQVGRRVQCPVCEQPANLTCRPSSETGQFQFDHKQADMRTTHGGGGLVPRLRLVEDDKDTSKS